MNVEMYRGPMGYLADSSVCPRLPEVKREIRQVADEMGMHARQLLAARHNQTKLRFHDLPSPTIKVEHGPVDSFVSMEAVGYADRAVGIEYGHEDISADQSASGPWRFSEGLYILHDAAKFTGLAGRWG